jgi:hypothetical protein
LPLDDVFPSAAGIPGIASAQVEVTKNRELRSRGNV